METMQIFKFLYPLLMNFKDFNFFECIVKSIKIIMKVQLTILNVFKINLKL